jgi:hypothetical protein
MPNATGGDTPNAEDDKDKGLEARVLALLEKTLPGVVNSAVTSQLKRATKAFDEKIAALTPKPKPEGEGEEMTDVVAKPDGNGITPKTVGEGAAVTKPAPDPELIALRKKFEKLEKDAAADKQLAATERRQRVEIEGYAAVKAALVGKVVPGVEGDVVDMLKGRGAIVIGDDGSVRLRLRASSDEPEEGLDLADGIGTYIKSPNAKHFIPAPNGGAAGMKKPPFQQPGVGARPAAPGGSSSPVAALEQATGKSIESLL